MARGHPVSSSQSVPVSDVQIQKTIQGNSCKKQDSAKSLLSKSVISFTSSRDQLKWPLFWQKTKFIQRIYFTLT